MIKLVNILNELKIYNTSSKEGAIAKILQQKDEIDQVRGFKSILGANLVYDLYFNFDIHSDNINKEDLEKMDMVRIIQIADLYQECYSKIFKEKHDL